MTDLLRRFLGSMAVFQAPDELNGGAATEDDNAAPVAGEGDLRSEIAGAFQSLREAEDGASSEGTATPAQKADEQAAPSARSQAAQNRNREDNGQFAPGRREQAAPAQGADQQQTAVPPPVGRQQAPQASHAVAGAGSDAPAAGPPPGWSVASKGAWEALPQAVRDDIAKREREVSAGFQAYAGLGQYLDECKQAGKSIGQVFGDYYRLEKMLIANPGQGLHEMVRRLGWTPEMAIQALGGVAQRRTHQVGQQQPGHQQPDDEDPLAEVIRPFMQPVLDKLNAFEAGQRAQAQAAEERMASDAETALADFAADPKNRYFGNVWSDMERMFQTGYVRVTGNWQTDLQTAYAIACQNNPEVRNVLIQEHQRAEDAKARQVAADKVARARRASVSVSGSPGGGTAAPAGGAANGTVVDDVRAAFSQLSQQV